MKFPIVLMLITVLLFSACAVTSIDTKENSSVQVGVGSQCAGLITAVCAEGLVCYNVTTSPEIIGVCYPIKDVEDPNFSPQEFRIHQELVEQGVDAEQRYDNITYYK